MSEALTPKQQNARRGMSILAGEGVGMAVSLGSLMLARGLAGKQLEAAKGWIAHRIILPMLDKFETVNAKLGRDKTQPEQWKQQTSPMERAQKYADQLVDLSIMWPAGLAVRLGIQSELDERLDVGVGDKRKYVFSWVVDNSVGLATMVGMNTLAKEPSRAMASTLGNVFTKLGVAQEGAESAARFITYIQVPNPAGLATNLATLHYLTKDKSADTPSR